MTDEEFSSVVHASVKLASALRSIPGDVALKRLCEYYTKVVAAERERRFREVQTE